MMPDLFSLLFGTDNSTSYTEIELEVAEENSSSVVVTTSSVQCF
jgi:hypothetical protein